MGLAWYYKNREKVLAKAKTPEERARKRAYYASTIERRRELDMARYLRHKTKRLAANKEYRETHRAVLKIKAATRAKRDRSENPEKFRIRNRADRLKHKTKRNETQRLRQRRQRWKCRLYEAKYLSKKPWIRTAKNNRRRVRVLAAKTDGTAIKFIQQIRLTPQLLCAYCGTVISGRTAHIDHILPLSKGGSHTADNLCAACEFCNCSKCDRTLAEWIPPIKRPVMVGV